MTDHLSIENRSKNMRAIKSKNTRIELLIRKTLFKMGYRYRIHYNITGKPDLVFVKPRIAIFIHGCFWHNHGCHLSSLPKSNIHFWQKKLGENKKRDHKNIHCLKQQGWKSIILWECNIKSNLNKELNKIIVNLQKRTEG